MRHSKFEKALALLLPLPSFTVDDAEEQGISRQALAYFANKGILERLSPGVYRSTSYEVQVGFEWEGLAEVATSIPDGVICLISALSYHQLTDQVMRESWIAVPHHLRAPRRANTRIIRMRNISLGQIKMMLGEYSVRIFDRERSVVDAFRYLSKEIAIKALQHYLRSKEHKPDLKKLQEYAKKLRVNLVPYILAYTT